MKINLQVIWVALIFFSVLPPTLYGQESGWNPQVPKHKLAVSIWENALEGHAGVVVDYSFSQYWGLGLLRKGTDRRNIILPVTATAPLGRSTVYETGGFTALELRRRFYHNNQSGITKAFEFYASLGVFRFHGYKGKFVDSGETVVINDKPYKNADFTVKIDYPPFTSASIGGGINFFVGSWFTTAGIIWPIFAPNKTYSVSSTSGNVNPVDLDQEVSQHKGRYEPVGGVGAIMAFVIGYAF